jgi:hypothetical protein
MGRRADSAYSYRRVAQTDHAAIKKVLTFSSEQRLCPSFHIASWLCGRTLWHTDDRPRPTYVVVLTLPIDVIGATPNA